MGMPGKFYSWGELMENNDDPCFDPPDQLRPYAGISARTYVAARMMEALTMNLGWPAGVDEKQRVESRRRRAAEAWALADAFFEASPK